MVKSKVSSVWVSGSVLAEALGISQSYLNKLRREGELKKGVHYRSIGRKMALRPSYRYHLKNIERDFQ